MDYKRYLYKLSFKFFVLFFCLIIGSAEANDNGSIDKRLELRNQTAIQYTLPESHLILAKYHYDTGNKIQAFYLSEHVRKVFGDEDFEPAFQKIAAVKLQKSPEFKNEQEYTLYCQENPNSFEAFMLELEKNLQNHDEKIIEDALKKYPDHYLLKAMAAKYYLKVRHNKEKALPLYIDLYFDNPHFYDWEYAEFRIKQITSSLKTSWFESKLNQNLSLLDIVARETNPRILDVLIENSRANWDQSLTPVMLEMLKNDDPTIQSRALHTLLNNPDSLKNSEEILYMLKSDDLTIRAIASFLLVKCFSSNRYNLLLDNLNSGIELIQLDTIQALGLMGGDDGKKFLKENRPENASEKMLDFWQQVTSK